MCSKGKLLYVASIDEIGYRYHIIAMLLRHLL